MHVAMQAKQAIFLACTHLPLGLVWCTSGSCGMVVQTAQLGRLTIKWHGDMIGGNGSFCPFLLPLPPLVEYRGVLLCGLLSNGNGAVILTDTADVNNIYVCLYVMSVDHFDVCQPISMPISIILNHRHDNGTASA